MRRAFVALQCTQEPALRGAGCLINSGADDLCMFRAVAQAAPSLDNNRRAHFVEAIGSAKSGSCNFERHIKPLLNICNVSRKQHDFPLELYAPMLERTLNTLFVEYAPIRLVVVGNRDFESNWLYPSPSRVYEEAPQTNIVLYFDAHSRHYCYVHNQAQFLEWPETRNLCYACRTRKENLERHTSSCVESVAFACASTAVPCKLTKLPTNMPELQNNVSQRQLFCDA